MKKNEARVIGALCAAHSRLGERIKVEGFERSNVDYYVQIALDRKGEVTRAILWLGTSIIATIAPIVDESKVVQAFAAIIG